MVFAQPGEAKAPGVAGKGAASGGSPGEAGDFY